MNQKMLDQQWNVYGIESPIPEWRFHPVRRWRLDYFWPKHKVAVEINGGIWSRGRHTRGGGFLGDMTKLNYAQQMGIRVFQFTPQELKNGICQTFMKNVFEDAAK